MCTPTPIIHIIYAGMYFDPCIICICVHFDPNKMQCMIYRHATPIQCQQYNLNKEFHIRRKIEYQFKTSSNHQIGM